MRQLLVVEGRRALADPVERKALDQLLAAHDLRVVVVAPAQQREVVDERLGNEAFAPELLDRDRAVPLRELLAVRAVQQRHVPVGRDLRP